MASTNKKGILERLSEGLVLGDGGYLLELEKRGRVRAGPFTPEVALNNPESLLELHREFRDAGAEVLQALTFYASRDKLAWKNSTVPPCASPSRPRAIAVWSPEI
jgi:betaine-homocysteine S-methyltransferase